MKELGPLSEKRHFTTLQALARSVLSAECLP